jgi:hypothetical protein
LAPAPGLEDEHAAVSIAVTSTEAVAIGMRRLCMGTPFKWWVG